jgi:hypothetical protein
MRLPAILVVLISLLLPAACEGVRTEATYPSDQSELEKKIKGKITGEEGIVLFGGRGSSRPPGAGASPIGVNSYLWRASLDTISFMPLASADPFGGVIITDWYAPPESQGERFKLNIYLLGSDLRADGVRAAVFRQLRERQGTWADAPVDEQTATDLENAILTRARQLRIASLR